METCGLGTVFCCLLHVGHSFRSFLSAPSWAHLAGQVSREWKGSWVTFIMTHIATGSPQPNTSYCWIEKTWVICKGLWLFSPVTAVVGGGCACQSVNSFPLRVFSEVSLSPLLPDLLFSFLLQLLPSSLFSSHFPAYLPILLFPPLLLTFLVLPLSSHSRQFFTPSVHLFLQHPSSFVLPSPLPETWNSLFIYFGFHLHFLSITIHHTVTLKVLTNA